MRKKSFSCPSVFLLCGVLVVTGLGQSSPPPFTKEEILQMLKPAPGKRVAQGDLAGEIEARGMAFPADEKTLEEFRKAGARSFVIDAIKRVAAAAARPQPLSPAPDKTDRASLEAGQRPSEEEMRHWSLPQRAAYRAAFFIEDLPNFVVTEIVSRLRQTPDKKGWQQQDKLEVELTYISKTGEKARLLKINARPTSQSFEAVGGASSSGQFGGFIGALLMERSQAQFKQLREEAFRGRKTMLYEFQVKKANSSYSLTDKTSGRKVITGYRGTLWVDTETAYILRLEFSAEDIEPGFPFSMAENAVEYDWVTIAGKKFFLPVSAEFLIGSDTTRIYDRNLMEFRNYRLFDTDMKILLDKEPPK
jgi:hypothetical protein